MNRSSNKALIAYIPEFLEYYKSERHSSIKTIESYKRLLKRFVIWLKRISRKNLLPEELSEEIIKEYKNHLSKQPISKITQNLYLTGIRALLLYFIEKDIISLHPSKVKLLKCGKSISKEPLSSNQLEKLLQSPKTSTITGLRDRALLETLISTGLKLEKIASLNQDEIKLKPHTKTLELKISINKGYPYYITVYPSEDAINWLKRYLQIRTDKSSALFIRYKGPKNAPLRLTGRSIENIVKRYQKKANLPSWLTPETLRDAYVFNLLRREDEIKIIQETPTHKSLRVNAYKFSPSENHYFKEDTKISQSLPWHTAENIINKEILWLKQNLLILPQSYKQKQSLINCDDCLLRKIAILIVGGKLKAIKFKAKEGKDLWNDLIRKQENLLKISKHGEEWHRNIMNVISIYFKAKNYKVIIEPILNYGRADLGIYSNPKENLYVEVGTVSLYKLWYNFLTMKNVSFLLVPFEDYAIEFRT